MYSKNEVPEGYKRCPKCGQIKPLSEFGTNKRNVDGKTSYCSVCTRAYAKDYNHKRSIKAREREHITPNLDRYSDEELYNELRRRGYQGKLSRCVIGTLGELERKDD